MQNLIEIQAKIAELKKQEKLILEQEYTEALEKVQALITQHKIPVTDLVFGFEDAPMTKKRKETSPGKKAEAKYRDASGNSWSGRGLTPKWLTAAVATGRKLEDFAIAQQA